MQQSLWMQANQRIFHDISFGSRHLRENNIAQTLVYSQTRQFQLFLQDVPPIMGRNSSASRWKTPFLQNEFPEFWEFQFIPRHQMSKDKKPWNIWKYLGMGENTSVNFWEYQAIIPSLNETVFGTYGNYWELLKHQWEFMGIPRNSQ